MKESMKKALVITLIAGLCLPIVGIAVAVEEPDYGEITVSPDEPTRQSDVNFSIELTGDDIEEVYIIVQECVGTSPSDPDYWCHDQKLNLSLTNVSGTWQGAGTLQYSDTDIGHCWLIIKRNGTWYNYAPNYGYETTDFTVVAGDDGADNNGADGGDDTGKTPGFELILVIFSIVVALFIYKKKRT